MFQSHIPHHDRDKKRPCSQSHVKHVSVSTAMALKASDRRHHAIEFIRNPVSSYFRSQVFIFNAIEFTRTAMNCHFRSQVRLSCDGKLTRNRSNSNCHPQSAIVILAPICVFHHPNPHAQSRIFFTMRMRISPPHGCGLRPCTPAVALVLIETENSCGERCFGLCAWPDKF